MKAVFSADQELMALVGRKLYTEDIVVIAVRELLQNSVDACKRAGVDPKISITLSHDSSLDQVTVTCTDNGCGMDQETIVTKFLRLGSSSKRGTKETGQFGVAKAVLNCGSFMSCRTLDNYLDSDYIAEEREILIGEPIEGTVISVTYQNESIYQYEVKALMMVAFSNVDVDYTFWKNGMETYHIEHCGLSNQLIHLAAGENWTAYGIEQVEVGNHIFHGRNLVRMNELVQFDRYVYGNSMEGNIIIDLRSDLPVTDPDFPLVMSREKMSGDADNEVGRFLSERATDSHTTDTLVRRNLETQDIKFLIGKILVGRRIQGTVETSKSESAISPFTAAMIASYARSAKYDNFEEHGDLAQYVNPGAGFPIIRLHNYNPDDESIFERDAKWINAWGQLLELLVYEGVRFGVGLIGEDGTQSEYQEVDGVGFFCLNPGCFAQQPSPEAVILTLWAEAAYELASKSERNHNEVHEATTRYILEATAHIVWANMKRLVKVLK